MQLHMTKKSGRARIDLKVSVEEDVDSPILPEDYREITRLVGLLVDTVVQAEKSARAHWANETES